MNAEAQFRELKNLYKRRAKIRRISQVWDARHVSLREVGKGTLGSGSKGDLRREQLQLVGVIKARVVVEPVPNMAHTTIFVPAASFAHLRPLSTLGFGSHWERTVFPFLGISNAVLNMGQHVPRLSWTMFECLPHIELKLTAYPTGEGLSTI